MLSYNAKVINEAFQQSDYWKWNENDIYYFF